MMDNKIMKKNS